MTGTPKFGFVLGPEARRLSSTDAEALEATGCDSLWTGGHVIGPDTLEVLTSLARIAGMTRRVQIGTAILTLPLYPAVLVAKQFAEIDIASGGRAALGVGVGSNDREMAALGVNPAERGARADEALKIIRTLWRGEAVTRTNAWWALDNVSIAPRPEAPPIYVAGRVSAAMRRAAWLGDGWMPMLFSPNKYAKSVAEITGYAQAARRGLDGFEWLVLLFVCADDDAAVAWKRASESLSVDTGVPPDRAQALLGKTAAVGTADDVAGVLTQYVQAGVTHFVLRACAPAPEYQQQIAKVMTEVVPLVRGREATSRDRRPTAREESRCRS
jgi:alkanesulfonate monooxygenase SsuD/methylene tetrahydromethanopterin reductase-like flavin-dependent oxidoreductase (luciferase family)